MVEEDGTDKAAAVTKAQGESVKAVEARDVAKTAYDLASAAYRGAGALAAG